MPRSPPPNATSSDNVYFKVKCHLGENNSSMPTGPSSPATNRVESSPSANAIARGLSNRKPVFTASRCEVRSSLLDPLDQTSEIRRSAFWGCSKFVIVTCLYWMCSHLFNQYRERHFIFDSSFFDSFIGPFLECIAFWSLCVLWSFNSVLNIELVHWFGYGWISWAHRLVTEGSYFAGIFGVSSLVTMGTLSKGFVFGIGNIYAMKSHSFIDVQYDLMGSEQEQEEYQKPTVLEFAYFIAVPSLIFEPEFPRIKDANKWGKVFLRSLHLIGTCLFSYVWLSEITIPIMVTLHEKSFLEGLVKCFVPMWVAAMLVFYTVFEVALNLCADLTGFGDRRFYGAWWNSTTFEEFNKEWNLPVHNYLLRHIYLLFLNKGYNKFLSQTITLLYSSILHEGLLFLITKRFRGWFFLLMMFQPTLFRIQNFIGMKGSILGNYFFWTSLILGISLAGTYYGQLWAAVNEDRNIVQYARIFNQPKCIYSNLISTE